MQGISVSKMKLFKIDKETILKIIGEYYGVPSMNVCLYSDYRFVRRGDDKVREDYIYGIVQMEGEPTHKKEGDAHD